MLRARLGQLDLARQDAEQALQTNRRPLIVYQAAGTFALCGDFPRALELLKEALRRDPQLLKLVPTDPDLAPLRKRPDFATFLRSAQLILQ